MNRTVLIGAIILFFVVMIFISGLYLGKDIKQTQDFKTADKQRQTLIDSLNNNIKRSESEAKLYRDSSTYYMNLSQSLNQQIGKTNKRAIFIKDETENKIAGVDSLSNDSNVVLFSKLAKEYLESKK